MEQIGIKYNNLIRAYAVLIDSIKYYQKLEKMPEDTMFAGEPIDFLLESAQRSMIQAFKVTIDVFWKYLKWLLEAHFAIAVGIINPRTVFTKACEIRFLAEPEVVLLLELVSYRNQTSHIYKQEVADFITKAVISSWPQLDALMQHCDPKKL